jgi:hypothetical protein
LEQRDQEISTLQPRDVQREMELNDVTKDLLGCPYLENITYRDVHLLVVLISLILKDYLKVVDLLTNSNEYKLQKTVDNGKLRNNRCVLILQQIGRLG